MSRLPAGWISTQLRLLGTPDRPAIKAGPFGSALKKEFYVRDGYRVYGQEQVIADDFSIGDYFIDADRFERLRACEVKPGDVLLSLVGTFGRASIVPRGIAPGIINPRLIRLSLDQARIDPHFLRYFFLYPSVQQRLELTAHGGTMGVLSAGTVGPLAIDLPPLPEQRRIVAKLESLQARSRRAREALEAVPPLLEKLRQSILAAAFRGDLTKEWRERHPDVEPASELLKRIRIERRKKWEEAELAKMKAKGKGPADDRWKGKYVEPEPVDDSELPELPERWCWASAEDLTDASRTIIYGIIKAGPEFPGGVPYVRVTEVAANRIRLDELPRCDPARAAMFSRSILAAGDLLVSKDGTIGKVAFVPPELEGGNINQHVLRVAAGFGVNRFFLARMIEAPHCQRWMTGETRGMALQGVNVEDFRRMPIPLAPFEEQKQVASAVDLMLTKRLRIAGAGSHARENLTTLDSAILSKAFRGELVPQEPGDVSDVPGDAATGSDGSVPGKTRKAKAAASGRARADSGKRGRRG